jgi:hypothetical protein
MTEDDDYTRIPNSVLERIEQWANAYPLDIFPEPGMDKVRQALDKAGITIDSVSASAMRHVITQVWQMLEPYTKGEKIEPVAWISHNSLHSLMAGGNSTRHTVPIHNKRSPYSRIPLYLNTHG